MLRRNNQQQTQAQAPAAQGAAQQNTSRYNTLIQPAHVEYDRQTSALRLGFGHGQFRGFGMIDLSPVFEEKRGMEAKKGESVFNYNDKMMVRITAQDAIVLRKQLAAIRSRTVEETVLNTSANKSITLISDPFSVCDLPEQYKGTCIGIITSEMKDGATDPLEYIWVCEHVEYEVYDNCHITSSEIFMDIFDAYLLNVIAHCTSGQFVSAGAATQAYGGAPAAASNGGTTTRTGFRRRAGTETQTDAAAGDNMGGETEQDASQPANEQQAQSSGTTARSNAMAQARAARAQSSTPAAESAPVATASVADFLEGFDGSDVEDAPKF